MDLNFSPLLKSLFNHSEVIPDKIAVYSVEGKAVSYKDVWEGILRASNLLIKRGIKKGDRVLLSAQKEVEFIYFYYASHLIGAVNVVIDATNSLERNQYITSVVTPALAIGVEIPDVDSITYNELNLNKFDAITPSIDSSAFSPDDTADVMFTSGTTGNPKGVRLSHFNIFSSASNINGFIGNTKDDVELVGLPICHSFGLGRLRCNLLLGATVVLHNGFANLKSVFESFEKYRVTGFGMVPAVFSYIKMLSGNRIGKFASQIKYIEIGSASMTLKDKILLCQLFPDTRICMHYGLTEASRAVFMEFHENEKRLSVAGKAVNDKVSIKIFNEEGEELLQFSEGEVCICGNMVINSYYLPEDNAESFFGRYFRTGDWGFIDDNGNLTLLARKKEMINVGGKKVSPIEIEEKVTKLGGGECMCVAIPDPDGILGEVPKVLLVKGKFKGDVAQLKTQLAEHLEPYKMPRIFEMVESIPKTESGKKKRI